MTGSFTTHEKLIEVEQMLKHAPRGEPDSIARRRYEVLKEIAADLRGRLDGAPSVAMLELERALVALRRSRTPAKPYPIGALIRVSDELIGRWPTVKQCLERFGAQAEGDAA